MFVDRFLDGDPANNGSAVPGVDPPAAYQGGDWAGVRKKIQDGFYNTREVTEKVADAILKEMKDTPAE